MTYEIVWSGKMPKGEQRTRLIEELKQLASVYHTHYFEEAPPEIEVFSGSCKKKMYIGKNTLRKITEREEFAEKPTEQVDNDFGAQLTAQLSHMFSKTTNKQKKQEWLDGHFQVDFVKWEGVQFNLKQRWEVTYQDKAYMGNIGFVFIDYLVVQGIEIPEAEGRIVEVYNPSRTYLKGMRTLYQSSAESRNWNSPLLGYILGYTAQYYIPDLLYAGHQYSSYGNDYYRATKLLNQELTQEENFVAL